MAEESKEEIEKKSVSEKWAIGITIFGGVIFFIALVWYLSSTYFEFFAKLDPDLAAKAGDFLGGIVGSLWALAGVLLVYSALQAQRRDFRINLESLKNQIQEYKEQKEVLEEQSETMRIQRFENGFYQLLSYHHNIGNSVSLSFTKLGKESSGLESLIDLCSEFEAFLKTTNPEKNLNANPGSTRQFIDVHPNNQKEAAQWLIKALEDVFTTQRKYIQNFMNLSYQIIQYVGDSSLVGSIDKPPYLKIIVNSLSPNILMMIILYGYHYPEEGKRAIQILLKHQIIKVKDLELIWRYEHIDKIIQSYFDGLSYKHE
jgi:hypothetical protein